MATRVNVIELPLLINTSKYWETYKSESETLLPSFLNVVETCLSEIQNFSSEKCELHMIYAELLFWLKSASKNFSLEFKPMLRLCRVLTGKESKNSGKELEEIPEVLLEIAGRALEGQSMEIEDLANEIFCQTVFALAACCQNSKKFVNPYRFENSFDTILLQYCRKTLQSTEKFMEFLRFFNELAMEKQFFQMVFQKKSYAFIVEVLVNALKKSEEIEAELLLLSSRFIEIYLEGCKGDLSKIKLKKICSIVLSSKSPQKNDFISQLLNFTFSCIEISNFATTNYLKLIFVVMLLPNLDDKLYFFYLNQLNSMDLSTYYFMPEAKSQVKKVVLSSTNLQNRGDILDLIFCLFRENFSVVELKLALRLCKLCPGLLEKILSLVLFACENTFEPDSYLEIKNPPYQSETFYNFSQNKEICIWANIQPLQGKQALCQLEANSNVKFCVFIENNSVCMEVHNKASCYKVFSQSFNVKTCEWLKFFVYLNIKEKKIGGKYEIHSWVNSKHKKFYSEYLPVIKEITQIKIEFTGKIAYFRLLSTFFSQKDLDLIESQENCLDFSSALTERYFSSLFFNFFNFKPDENLQITMNQTIFQSFATIGGLSFMLPLLEKSESHAEFMLFFQVLSKFCQHFSEVFSIGESFFTLLKVLLIAKTNLMSKDWLETFAELLIRTENTVWQEELMGKIMMCPLIWHKIPFDFMIFYIEIIKEQMLRQVKSLSKEKIQEICNFFLKLAGLADESSKKYISKGLFTVLEELLMKESKDECVLAVISEVFNEVENVDLEGCQRFLWEISKKKWKITNFEFYRRSFDILTGLRTSLHERFQEGLLMFVLDTIPNNIQYFNQDIPMNFLFSSLSTIINPYRNMELCKILINFVANQEISMAPASKVINIVSEILFPLKIQNFEMFNEIFHCGYLKAAQNPHFCSAIYKQCSFPGWVCQFMPEVAIFEDSEIFEFSLLIFSNSEFFQNFDKLRIFLQFILQLEKYDWVIKFCGALMSLSTTKSKDSQKYWIEMVNVVEDIIGLMGYEHIDKDLFSDLALKIEKAASEISYSLVFPKLPGFIGYNFFSNSEKPNKSVILLRDGGVCRQILKFLFIALSFEPNPLIESILKHFFKNKQVIDGDPIEWKKLESDPSVQKLSFVTPNKVKSSRNLLYIYIYSEWAETIKNYHYKNLPQEKIKESAENLWEFMKKEKITKRLEKEVKSSSDSQNIKEYEKIKAGNWEKIIPTYLKESQNDYEKIRRFYVKDDKFANLVTFEGQKPIKLKGVMEEYVKSLNKCGNASELLNIICGPVKNFEASLFLLVLASFKLSILSSKYFYKPINYVYTRNNDFFQSFPLEDPADCGSIAPSNVPGKSISDLQGKNLFKVLKKTSKVLSGVLNEKDGDFCLKSNFDNLGRKLFLVKKKLANFSIDKKYVEKASMGSILEETSTVNESLINFQIDESIEFSVSSMNENPLSSEDFFIEESCISYEILPSASREIECEIIAITGTIYGSMSILSDCIVFNSSLNEKIQKKISGKNPDGTTFLISSQLAANMVKVTKEKTKIWLAKDIKEIIIRRFIHALSAIEIYFSSGKSVMVNFFTSANRSEVYFNLRMFENFGVKFLKISDLRALIEKWRIGEISNFEYLMILNKYAGRTFHDVHQYPVFPWILSDYSSKKLDLNNEKVFRDLRYPVCAQSSDGKASAKTKYLMTKQNETHPYNFGSHYSTGGNVLHFLVRLQPFTQEAKKLQGGGFDLADRLFYSIKNSWASSQRHYTDVKELIPEFFYLPEIFVNGNKEYLGMKQNKKMVNDVKLPKWAKKSVYYFLKLHRKALESAYVSKNLHYWIDLIFGFRQSGQPGAQFFNIFYPITYEESYIEALETSPIEIHEALCNQSVYFGQTPIQILKKQHPKRSEESLPKLSLPERILSKYRTECTKRYSSSSPFILLSTQNLLIILKASKTCTISKYKCSSDRLLDFSSVKEYELMGVQVPSKILAALFQEEFIVTAGYLDFGIYFHNLTGKLCRIIKTHTLPVTCLSGGKNIATGSEDSTVVFWSEIDKKIHMHGHFSPIQCLSVMEDFTLIASCSAFLLIHDFRTGNVLRKIDEQISRIFSNSSGIFITICKDEMRLISLNGQKVKSFNRPGKKIFSVIDDFLISDESSCLKFSDFFEAETAEIQLQEPLEVTQIHYIACTDSLFIINLHEKFSLFSVEVSSTAKTDFWI